MQDIWDCEICRVCENVGLMTWLSLKKVDKKSLAVTRYRGKHLLDFPPLLRVGPASKKGVAGSGWLWECALLQKKGGWQWLALVLGEEQTVGSRQQNTSPVKTPASSEQSRKSKISDFSYTDNQVNGQSTIFSFILLWPTGSRKCFWKGPGHWASCPYWQHNALWHKGWHFKKKLSENV